MYVYTLVLLISMCMHLLHSSMFELWLCGILEVHLLHTTFVRQVQGGSLILCENESSVAVVIDVINS